MKINILCHIAITHLDAMAMLLGLISVPVGDVIPELLKSPVELQRLCKLLEPDPTELGRCCDGCGVRTPGGGGGGVCVGEGEVGTGDTLVELGLSECNEPVD
jgi:hypothetical protein